MFYSKAGAIPLNTSPGSQTISGLGFQPKLVLFQSTPDTSNIVDRIANMHWSMGASDGTNNSVQAANARNGIVTSDTRRYADDTNVIFVADPPGTMTPDYVASLASFDPDGFTLNVSDAPPVNYRFGYLALGGDDITNVAVGRFNSKGSVGLSSISGLGFQPDVVLVFTSGTFGAPPVDLADACVSIGCANGLLSPNQWSMGASYQDGAGSAATVSDQAQGYIISTPMQTGFVSLRAVLVSFDVDGFTLNWTNHSIIPSVNYTYVAIKGTVDLNTAVGLMTMPNNTTGATNAVTGLGFEPSTGLFSSIAKSTVGLLQQPGEHSIGWADENYNHYMTAGVSEKLATWASYHASSDERVIRRIDYNSPTLLEDVSLQTWDTDGFTLYNDVGPNPTTQSYIGYLVFSGLSTPPPTPTNNNFGFIV